MGLKNAPAEFQRYMEGCLEGLRDECCAPYLDDVIIFFRSFDEHIKHVRKVFRGLKENSSIKLKAKKCDLFKKEVKYLGWIVSQEGYLADPENTKTVVSLKERTPKTVREVRQLMGLLGYYQRYIENFPHVAMHTFEV